jgi:hypothetical protein
MHIEILVEDSSGQKLLEAVLPKLLGEYGEPHTWSPSFGKFRDGLRRLVMVEDDL